MQLSALRDAGSILVTGHTGFKGSWLLLLLAQLGIETHGVALEPESGSLGEEFMGIRQKRDFFCDIRNGNEVKRVIKELQPATSMHLAAQSLVKRAWINPQFTFETNVMGTYNVVAGGIATPSVRNILVVTTDKVYREQVPGYRHVENDPLGGDEPYSASKVGAEAVVQGLRALAVQNNGSRIFVARAGNVVGGGDVAEHRLLPDLVRGFIKGERVIIRNPSSTRPWQHVLDPLFGYLQLLNAAYQPKSLDDEYNFGPDGESLSVSRVCEIARSVWGGSTHVEWSQEMANNVESVNLALDSSRAREGLGWFSSFSQEESIERTVKWWANLEKSRISMTDICNSEIDEFLIRKNSGVSI